MANLFFIFCLYSIISVLFYVCLMFYFRIGLNQLHFNLDLKKKPNTFITVVVCFRNEEQYLTKLLNSLTTQNYPQHFYEIVLYNDASSDNSVDIINKFISNCKSQNIILRELPVLPNSNAAKKIALNDAAKISKAELIVVTDADCTMDENWLTIIEHCYQTNNSQMISGPVSLQHENSWINALQKLELHGLAAASAGAFGKNNPIMCNGANMAFNRITFLSIDPFKNNLHINSGDDMFLMMAMHKENAMSMHFLAHPNAMVSTVGKNNLSDYINQRVRWASKSKSYTNNLIKVVALVVLNLNLLIVLSIILCFIFSIKFGLIITIGLIILKQLSEMYLLQKFTKLFNVNINYFQLFLFQYIEAVFTVLVAIKSIKGSYIWKGRRLQV
ncbi:MAG TPA: glycosyltransferase [Bacteroidia bacterium]|nr:glycosyltransferase [Bacteroidia bacterium]